MMVDNRTSRITNEAVPAGMVAVTSHRVVGGTNPDRRGSMALAAMMALLVVVGGVAVALDRLWLDTSKTELETAVEAAALRGGRFLASDDLLRPEADIDSRLEKARQAVSEIAAENLVAGKPIELDTSPEGDVRFGKLVRRERTGESIFLETSDGPTSVVVRGLHSRARNNPVAMFFNSWTGNEGADVAALAEATIDNHVVALQPLKDVPIPVCPLAILNDSDDEARESWTSQIENGQGADRFSYDEATGEITQEPDGIPEICLRSAVHRGDPEEANVHLFVVNHRATENELAAHIQFGWTEADLPQGMTELTLEEEPLSFKTVNGINGMAPRQLKQLLGECRIMFLYDQFESSGRSGAGTIQVRKAVAGRILAVGETEDDCCELIIQPGIMTTRTAVLDSEGRLTDSGDARYNGSAGLSPADRESNECTNRYIYKLQITN